MELRVTHRGFAALKHDMAGLLATRGELVDTGHWQSLTDVPQTRTIELRNVTIVYQIPRWRSLLEGDVMPSDPWAELHFAERVGGEPVNPGNTYHLWPYFKGNVPQHQNPADGEKFSHTYMERFWPRYAGANDSLNLAESHTGIRYRYGDLQDVIGLLADHPHTRQAYLPVWFPEDTGATSGQRVPCTLGYHFMLRAGRLHVMYPIRSCDFLRHFTDDVYLASRLVQWILEELQHTPGPWPTAMPGELTMHMHSLHVFEPEMPILRRMATMTEDEFVGGAV